MTELNEIEAELRAEPSELREKIVRDVGSFTVALFAIHNSAGGARLQLGGTGTLVTDTKAHYILTARHVWDEVLRGGANVGITLKEDIDHSFLIQTQVIVHSGPTPPQVWDEWGPDVVFLRIPPELLGTINVYKVFYGLNDRKKAQLGVDCIELHMLMGTPKEQGLLTNTHADLQITGMLQNISERCTRGEFDYLDLDMDLSLQDVPQDFGGVSGGGLWQVLVYKPKAGSKTDWMATLEGTAFYQSAPANGHRLVRCHGLQGILKNLPA